MKEVSSIKEYYIKLHNMMNNCVNMLTALSQSLTTSSPEITLKMIDASGEQVDVRVPSFIYIENKLESLENTIDMLTDLPNSGEAWFNKSSNMYKLELVKSNVAPSTPIVKGDALNEIRSYITKNNILKDVVNPQMSLRIYLGNIGDNISEIAMKKYVFFNESLASQVQLLSTHDDYEQLLSTLTNGVEYESYEKILKMPMKRNRYVSAFTISDVDEYSEDETDQTYKYTVHLNTLKYYDKDDAAIEYKLKTGDKLTLENDYVIYTVKSIRTQISQNIPSNITYLTEEYYDHIVELVEETGHVMLQTTTENTAMVLHIYEDDYEEYKYIDVPLEENQYISIFLASVYNNVRSTWSAPMFFNLNDILVYDENGNAITNHVTGKKLTYLEYYNRYCVNLGDLVDGISKVAYMQLTNLPEINIKELLYSTAIKEFVNDTLRREDEDVMHVTRINKHIINDESSQNIKSLHEQKSQLNSQLRAIQNNIDTVYEQLTNTDFSQEISISQESLRTTLNEYYNQRSTMQEQLLGVIDNINILKGDVANDLSDKAKYRIRGITNIDSFETYLHEHYSFKLNIIGCDIEYRYKSLNSSLSNLESTYNTVFTPWNKQSVIERERVITFDPETNVSKIEFVSSNTADDSIKWNQIDIPITNGESVIVRIRYKYNLGQPFIDLYTPWSNDITIDFPAEFVDSSSVDDILDENNSDLVSNKFIRTLIKEGYQDHNNNKIIDNSVVYYHMPENIYSGFNTPENKLISLKDKLTELTNELTEYKSMIDNELGTSYRVYIEYDNNSIELHNDTSNSLMINELQGKSVNSFIKKEMNIIIKNTGTTPIKLYSIFPGNVNTPLLLTNKQFYNQYIVNYERVPMYLKGAATRYESICAQTLGQWIYFRQTDPYMYTDLYFNSLGQRNNDVYSVIYNLVGKTDKMNSKLSWTSGYYKDYINKNNMQPLLGYRKRSVYADDMLWDSNYGTTTTENWGTIEENLIGGLVFSKEDNTPTVDKETGTITSEMLFDITNSANMLQLFREYNELVNKYGIDYFIYDAIGTKTIQHVDESGTIYTDISDTSNIIDSQYVYTDNKENKWIGKYSHFVGTNNSSETDENDYVYLTENDDISLFIKDKMHSNTTEEALNGAFLYPELTSKELVKCDVTEGRQYKTIEVGKSISVPVVFEYYLNGTSNRSITKTISFDLRTSLFNDPINYTLSIKAQHNLSLATTDTANQISLYDELISNENIEND